MENYAEISSASFYGKRGKIAVVPKDGNVSEISSEESDAEEEEIGAYETDDEEIAKINSNVEIIDQTLIYDSDLENIESDDPTTQNEVMENNSNFVLLPKNKNVGKRTASTNKENKKKKQKKTLVGYNWKKEDIEPSSRMNEILEKDDCSVLTPLEYFFNFFSYDCIENMVHQSNLYSVQETGKSINTNNSEMTDFISIMLTMGVIDLPSLEDYWSHNCRIAQVADLMPRNRFKILRRRIHFNDNSKAENSNDKFYKIRPLLDEVRKQCLKTEEDIRFSIDETVVPYKGTRAGNLRQYNPKKPKKWGYKFFTRAGISGIIYDFLPYQGSQTFEHSEIKFTEKEGTFGVGGKVVIHLSKTIPQPKKSIIYFDNWFSSLSLFTYLKDGMDILSLGTARSDRIQNCPLSSDKDLLKNGKGTFDFRSADGVIISKWADNKCVLLGSTVCGVEPQGSVKRYCKEEKKKVNRPCPAVILQYNKHMGGVDKSNCLVALYRSPSKAKRWYFPIFTYMLDLCVAIGWLLYKQHCIANKGKPKNLKTFRLDIAGSLAHTGKPKRVRPSINHVPQEKIRLPLSHRPDSTSRYDGVQHWPVHTSKGRCRFCVKGTSRIKCDKCDSRLCLTDTKNCFYDFHNSS